jgi:predicted secreted protein
MTMHEQLFLGGAPVVGFGDADILGAPLVTKSLVGLLVGSIGGAVLGSFVKEGGAGAVLGTIVGGLSGAAIGTAMALQETGDASATAAAAQPSASAVATMRTYDKTSRSIAARTGERFAVALEANASTGASWRLDPSPDAAVVALADQKYTSQPPPNCPSCAGFGGTETFTFTAVGVGNATLHFKYGHPWEPSVVANEITIEVRVQ